MKRLNPSMIISVIALFVALGGSAYATGQALIGSEQIKDRSINPIDLNQRTISLLRGRPGLQGPVGIPGVAGPAGPAGAPGGFNPAKVSYVVGPQVSVLSGGVGVADATCPAGTKVIGGAFVSSLATPAGSYPVTDFAWRVIVTNNALIPVNINAAAICAAP